MDVNFARHCFITDHVLSALKENCIIGINGIKSKNVLIYYIIREFSRKINSSSIVLFQNTESEENTDLKTWVNLHSNLIYSELSNCEGLFDSHLLQRKCSIYRVPIESFLICLKKQPLTDKFCLFVIDLTFGQINESILEKVKSLFFMLSDKHVRIVLILNIENYLNSPKNIDDWLTICCRALPVAIKLASDSISIGSNGNLIETKIIDIQDNIISNDLIIHQIYQNLNACEEVLSFHLKIQKSCKVLNLLLQKLKMLTLHLKMFGILAFSLSLNFFDNMVQGRDNELEECGNSLLILKFLRTKSLVLLTMTNYFNSHAGDDLSISLTLKKCLDQLEDFVSGENGNITANGRCAFLLESIDSAEILYSVLQELKVLKCFRYLDLFSIIIITDLGLDDKFLNSNNAIIITTVTSPYLYKLKLDRCVSFVIPSHYSILLDIKRSLQLRNGLLCVLINLDNDYAVNVKKVSEFQQIEASILKRTPWYINPTSLVMRHDLCAFQPLAEEYQIVPEAAIAVVNRYCNCLSTRMSRAAIDFDFSMWNDGYNYNESCDHDSGIEMLSAQTKIYLPVKSMIKQTVKAPTVKLPGSGDSTTELQLLSRMASSLEVCKMLYENNDDIFSQMMRGNKNYDNKSSENDQILTRSSVNKKEIPILLKNGFPKQNSLMYIYVIKTRNAKEVCLEPFQKYLGFCCTRRLKKFPSFLIYNRAERLMKSVTEIERPELLTEKNVGSMYNFHAYVIKRVLGYVSFDCDENSVDFGWNGVLWTVLKHNDGYFSIDHEFLETFPFPRNGSEIFNSRAYDDKPSSFSYSDFDDKVIMPLHRKTDEIFYYARRVREDILVDCKLSDKSNDITFIDYYRSKYGIDLTPGQHVVEVIPVQKYLNFFELRYQEGDGSSSKRRQTIFMPIELCLIHPIPAHLWMQIVAIPVILQRLSSLLYLVELEQYLIKELELQNSDVGPCLDANLNVSITEIHKERDQLGLQRVEDAVVELVDCSNHIDIDVLNDKIDSSHLMQEDLAPIELDNNVCGKTGEDIVEPSASFTINEDGPFPERDDTITEKKQGPKNGEHVFDINVTENAAITKLKSEYQNKKRKMPPLSLMLVAMTSVDAQDIFNYERFEFLGDAFLAFSVAVEEFLHHNKASDHSLSRKKSRIVSNVNLLAKGNKRKLWKYIVAEKFDFKVDAATKKLLNIEYFQANKQVTETACSDLCEDPTKHKKNSPSMILENATQQPENDCIEVVVRNKLVADCVEAIIGLFYIHNGEKVALDLMHWFNFDVCCIRKRLRVSKSDLVRTENCKERSEINPCEIVASQREPEKCSKSCESLDRKHGPKVKTDDSFSVDRKCNKKSNETSKDFESHGERRFYSFVNNQFEIDFQMPADCEVELVPYISEQLSGLETILQYQFNNKNILLEALLHPSYPCRLAPPLNCNQRLEFLGDSIFYLLISDYICRRYPSATNAELTCMRCIIVNTRTFAKVAYLNEFHKYLMVISPGLSEQILNWSRIIEEERKDGNLWPKWNMSNLATFHDSPISKMSIPKDLADVFESVAAAIFVDSGRLDVVWCSYYLLLRDVLNSLP